MGTSRRCISGRHGGRWQLAGAALIGTLLGDPGDAAQRKAILERMAGWVVKSVERKRVNGRLVENVRDGTAGGILHWGRENGEDLRWFRDEIRRAYAGRTPRVLDPFAGGGAVPLEALRLGCDVTAIDINPVAWFILKCTLEYPQRLVGEKRPLPDFALRDAEFMAAFFKEQGFQGSKVAHVSPAARARPRKRGSTRPDQCRRSPARSGPCLAHACLGTMGASACADASGAVLPHLCRIRTAD